MHTRGRFIRALSPPDGGCGRHCDHPDIAEPTVRLGSEVWVLLMAEAKRQTRREVNFC
jgi:hypothetical protein